MKRARPRQEPVSCELCRSKKLKCNREQPCSNCVSRGVTCRGSHVSSTSLNASPPASENAAILERLQRLEAIVLQPTTACRHFEGREKCCNIERERCPPLATSTPNSDATLIPEFDRNRDQDTRILESIGTQENPLLPCLSNGLVFEQRSIPDILYRSNFSQRQQLVSRENEQPTIFVSMPEYSKALQLFECYKISIDPMVSILHLPTVRALLEKFYCSLEQDHHVELGHAVLLLAIFAIATYFLQSSNDRAKFAEGVSEPDALRLAAIWSKATLDVLDHCRRTTSGTLECAQASVIVGFVIYHFDGFSPRGRALMVSAITIARELDLHRLDEDDELPRKHLSTQARIDCEIKRRVWWHLASTDWLVATFGGPQEGTYFIHPNHMKVNLPKDCLDEELGQNGDSEVLDHVPSGMTYFLHRVRLSEICREMVDILPYHPTKISRLDYDHIMRLDGKFDDFLKTLPSFLRLDAESRKKSAELNAAYPYLPALRYYITTSAYSRRCKLHQPFLIRQSLNPRYAYSRKICLESARTVIQLQQELHHTHLTSAGSSQRLSTEIYFMQFAVIVLVMDLCFNKDETNEIEVKNEVKAALKVFEGVRKVSSLPDQLISSLKAILQKYKVQLSDTISGVNIVPNTNAAQLTDVNKNHSRSKTNAPVIEDDALGDCSDLETNFDEFWQIAIQNEYNLEMPDWDNLFSGLDTHAI